MLIKSLLLLSSGKNFVFKNLVFSPNYLEIIVHSRVYFIKYVRVTFAFESCLTIFNNFRAQSFLVHLPADFTCENCTLRLLRQADEWGGNYRFWSCADIDIKDRKYI